MSGKASDKKFGVIEKAQKPGHVTLDFYSHSFVSAWDKEIVMFSKHASNYNRFSTPVTLPAAYWMLCENCILDVTWGC